ncbi:jg21851 [Pararge aegeria aegeria]|uniref:Jg21851 protein n=1 Tax=Pararge aegeria aegeria TaxID=348720 RepID=A0A8S4QY51_9NEOP|nr:jg21851 [Pararge aegeria aegeria]
MDIRVLRCWNGDRTGKRSVTRPPTRWTEDIRRVAGSRLRQAAQDRVLWNSLQKTYVQQWASIGWNDDDRHPDTKKHYCPSHKHIPAVGIEPTADDEAGSRIAAHCVNRPSIKKYIASASGVHRGYAQGMQMI